MFVLLLNLLECAVSLYHLSLYFVFIYKCKDEYVSGSHLHLKNCCKSLDAICVSVCVSVSKYLNIRIQQTSNNEPHPGALKGAVSHVAGTVDALIGKSCVLHGQHSSAIDHVVPVSHVIVVSYTKHTENILSICQKVVFCPYY